MLVSQLPEWLSLGVGGGGNARRAEEYTPELSPQRAQGVRAVVCQFPSPWAGTF